MNNTKGKPAEPGKKEIVIHIDREQFKVKRSEMTVRELLALAGEEPAETTLVFRHGNEAAQVRQPRRGGAAGERDALRGLPQQPDAGVLMYGPDRLLRDLLEMGYEAERMTSGDGNVYVVIRSFVVQVGRFADRVIDLGLLAPQDSPRTVGSSIHIRATPQLLEYGSVPNVRNIIQSSLGPEWRYWSHSFGWSGERSTRRLLSQVNTIFANA